jgi:hypothetical protein
MTTTEWVVSYWTSTGREERRFLKQDEAMKFAMRLPAHAKLFVDEVLFGEPSRVR